MLLKYCIICSINSIVKKIKGDKLEMNDKLKQQNIQRISILTDKTIEILNNNKINTLEQLCRKSTMELKEFGIKPNTVNKIEIELQLLGLKLRNSL